MSHHHSRSYQAVHNPETQRVLQEFKRIGEEAVQYVNSQIGAAGITLRPEERSYLIYTYIVEHTTEQAVITHYRTMLSKLDAQISTNIQQQILSYRDYVTGFIENIPADNPLHIQGEQALVELKLKEASMQPCRDENLKNYMELGKEGSAFIDQKVAAGDIRPLTNDEHTKIVNQYIEYRAEIPAVKTYAETMETSIDEKIEYDAYEAQRYIAYKKHHDAHKHATSFFYNLFKVIAIGAVAVFAPPLVGTVAPIMASLGTAGTFIGTGVACAGADALCQSVGVATGLQQSFSVNEVLETGVSVGLGSAVASAGMIPTAMTSAAGGAVTQALEVQIGTRDDLDPLAAVTQGATSIVSSVVNQVIPSVNNTIEENFPDTVKTIGEENVAVITQGVAHATTNTAVQSAALNVPMSLEGILTNSLGSVLGTKIGTAINDVLSKFDIGELSQTELNEEDNENHKKSIGDLCAVEENQPTPVPSAQEMVEFTDMLNQTLERMKSSEAIQIADEIKFEALNTSEPKITSSDTTTASTDGIEVIPPIIVEPPNPDNNQESFFDSLSDWQKAGLSIGVVLGAVALLPEELGGALLLGLGRIGTALMPGVGPLSEALAVDAVAGEAIAGTAAGAAATGFISKAMAKFGFIFSGESKPTNIMLSQQAAKNECSAGVQGSKGVDFNRSAQNQITRLELSTELALKEANILKTDGTLTAQALKGAFPIMKKGELLGNPTVLKELTKDGSKITDWQKFSTQSITLPTGQRIQVHFYQNTSTGKVNYTHADFKVKNLVDTFYNPESPNIVSSQSILNNNRSQP